MYEVSSLQKTGTQTQNRKEITKYGNRLPKSFVSRKPEVNSLATPTLMMGKKYPWSSTGTEVHANVESTPTVLNQKRGQVPR